MGSLYSDQHTWLHGVRAGLKLALLAVLGAGVFATKSLPVLIACALACLAMFVSLGTAIQRVKPLLWGMTIACALIGLFHLYMGQAAVGAVSVLRLLCTTLMGLALTLTTRHTDLLAVLEWLLTPLRAVGVQPDRLSLQVALMLRFTEHFFIMWRRLDDAHRLRTGRAGGFKILAPLTIQMLVAARRVADTLHVRFRR